jgi:hypothetical protein
MGVLCYFACQTPHNSIVGKYSVVQRGKYPKIIPITLFVELNTDSTFSYNYRGGFHGETSSGTWHIEKSGKAVVLDSYIQNMQQIPIVVTESKDDTNKAKMFVFNNPLKADTLTKWVLNINGIDYAMDADSIIFNDLSVNSFHLRGFQSLDDSTHIIPIPLQDTIQSKTYFVKSSDNNIYRMVFLPFVNYDIFHYKPICGRFVVKNNTMRFNGTELRKK